MTEIWERRDGESDSAYQALRDYLRIGVRRSLSKLCAQYTRQASSKRTVKQPPTTSLNTLETWSHQHEWVKRAKAYDIDEQRKLDAALEANRQKLIDDELADYRAELRRFREVRSKVLPSYFEQVSEVKAPDPDDPNKTIITRTIVEHIDIGTSHALTKWRLDISALGRRANGMPEKITEALIDDNVDADKTFKAYIGISPDDWDDGPADDNEANSAL